MLQYPQIDLWQVAMELAWPNGQVKLWYNKVMAEIKAIFHKCEPPETGYWAEVPSLPGCVSEGATLEECKAMIRDAAEGWLESAWELVG